jgi:peptidyl-prolyl cis-trans isomerase D
MLDLFRRLSRSKVGLFVFALFLAALVFGFAAADIQGLGFSGSGTTGDKVAEIGNQKIGYTELQQRVQRAFDNARRERPELTMQQFVRQGGVDRTLQQMADSIALEQFARSQGFGVSRKMEDALIASAPAFKGLNGQFDQSAFEQFLVQQRISEKQIRADLARDLYINQLIVPVTGAALAPRTLVLPYASMLLEQRTGRVQFVPAAAFRGAPPTDAELADFYRRNAARYITPERRVIRYALLNRAAFEAAATPSEQEIAAAYNANKAAYAPKETRTVSQVILPTEAAARQLAQRVSSGTPIADAARAAGLESVTLNDQTREAYAQASAPAVAQAVFATAQGQVAAPARSGLGWHVARVDRITTVAGRSLDQARQEIVERLRREKASTAWTEAIAKVEDAVNEGATFDEVVAANKLQPQATPPLLASGRPPDSDVAPPPELAAIVKSGFSMEAGDDPVVEQIVPDQTAALVKTEQVLAAAPKPLAQIREQVAADLVAERGLAQARRAAEQIATRANAGTPLAQAVSGAGVGLPAATTVSGQRGELLRQNQPTSPQLNALFTLGRGRARAVRADDGSGWYVVALENSVPGNAIAQPQLVEGTRSQFAPVLGQEYGAQLAAAARRAVGVEINAAAVARLKSELVGGTAAQ